MNRTIHILLAIFAVLLFTYSAQTRANIGWLPNMVHYINNTSANIPRQPAIELPDISTGGNVVVNWSTFDGVAYEFLLEYQLIGSNEWITLYQGTETNYVAHIAWQGGSYTVRLSCVNSPSCPIVEPIEKSIMVIAAPLQPTLTGSASVVKSNTAFEVSFPAVYQADEYQLFENNVLIKTIETVAAQEVYNVNLMSDVAGNYSYQLQACNVVACSELSTQVSVQLYIAATKPLQPKTTKKAYALDNEFEIQWPEPTSGLTFHYFYAQAESSDISDADLENAAIEITPLTSLKFTEVGYVWLFVNACDELNKCGDYSAKTRIQVFKRPEIAPELLSVSLYGSPVNNDSQIISVSPGAKFVLHWQQSKEKAPSTIGYYRVSLNGEWAGTLYGVAGYLKTLYPDGWFHREFKLDTAGKYTYSVQACNRVSNTGDELLDCSSESKVTVFVGMPVPENPIPENPLTHVSVSLYGAPLDINTQELVVKTNEKFVLHWSTSNEVMVAPTGSYQITKNGQNFGTIWGVSGYLKRLYPDGLFHREFSIDVPGEYYYSIAGCNFSGTVKNCGPESSMLKVTVYSPPEPPKNNIENLSASLYGLPIVDNQQTLLVEKNSKFILHWKASNEIAPGPIGFYQISKDELPFGNVYGVSGYLKTLYPDGMYHWDSSVDNVGTYSYGVVGCNLIDNERKCGPVGNTLKVNVFDQFTVFEDIAGNLFVALSNEHGNKRLKLSFADGAWLAMELTLAQWSELNLAISKYILSFGQFSGDTLEDLKLTNAITSAEIIMEQTNNGFSYHKPVENIAPIISGEPSTHIVINNRYSFRPQASDANNNSLTFAISNKPDWAKFDTSTGELAGVSAVAGLFNNIVISVTDNVSEPVQLPAFNINVTTKKIIIHTDLLGTPVAESASNGGAL